MKDQGVGGVGGEQQRGRGEKVNVVLTARGFNIAMLGLSVASIYKIYISVLLLCIVISGCSFLDVSYVLSWQRTRNKREGKLLTRASFIKRPDDRSPRSNYLRYLRVNVGFTRLI